jgi:sugar lactone lactonase YvrE
MQGTGEVWITSPAGKRLGTIELPTVAGEPQSKICASNIAFGDPDGKGLYITACQAVYHLRLKAAGIRPTAAQRR